MAAFLYSTKKVGGHKGTFYSNNTINTMFQQLENFKDKTFFNQNNKILIKDNNNIYTYEVFSVYVVTTIDKIETNFIFKKDFLDYVKLSTEKSLHKSSMVVNEGDKILTLVTCSYEYKEARTIIVAKLLKNEIKTKR